MIGSDVLRLVAALAVTLGALVVALHLLRRLHSGTGAPGRVPLRILDRVPIGPRQGVALLQVGERVLVVALAEGGLSLLGELDGAERERALTGGPSGATPRFALPSLPGLPSFGRWRIPGLPSLVLLAALAGLLAPAAARAQGTPTSRPAPISTARPAPPAAAPAAAPAVPASPRPAVATVARPGVAAPRLNLPAARTSAIGAARAPKTRPLPLSPPTSPAPAPPKPAAAVSPAPLTVAPPVMPQVDIKLGEGKDALHLSGTVGLVVFMGVLTLLPAMFLLMTSFTRILIVLHFVRSALGTQTAPPGQLLVAIAVLLTGVVMNPVFQQANREAIQPYLAGRLEQVAAYQKALVPFREFMVANTRDKDLQMFAELSGATDVETVEQLPIVTVISAFVVSELRTAFQMGFVIYLPFVVVDLIVASVLMSMGMFMLPPAMISLPFKLLLFVLADGWTLVVQNLVASFR